MLICIKVKAISMLFQQYVRQDILQDQSVTIALMH